jgi:pimeloyl-ACP methyl ester carboxylesterase
MGEIATINGTGIWFEMRGSGPCMVQIGGAVSAHEGYAPITEQLTADFEILDYDHRGYGLSDRPDQRYDIDVWCDDLVALLDHVGRERVHVHGGSMGSFVAIGFALRYPERVDRLLLGAGAVARCDQMGISHFRVWQHLASAYGVESVQMAEELVNKAFSRHHIDTVGLGPLTEAMVDSTTRNTSTHVFIDACQVMIDADVAGGLAQISSPTLVMVGSADVLTPLDAGPAGLGARAVSEMIPDARLAVFEGSGHGHYVEQPDQTLAAIYDFMS